MESIKVVDLATDQIVKIGDLTNNAARVNIVAGGVGGGASQIQVRSVGGVSTDVGFAAGNLNVPVQLITALPAGANVIGLVNQGTSPWIDDPIDRATRLLGIAKIVDTAGVNQLAITAANAAKVDGSAVTQPVSIAAALDVSDRITRLVGVIRGEQADNAVNPTTKVPTLAARANAAVPAWTEGNVVPLSTDLSGRTRILDYALTPPNTNVATNLTITASTTFPNVTVPSGARYVLVLMFVTGVVSGTAPTLAVQINLQEPQSGNFLTWLASVNLTATNTGVGILVGPDVVVSANTSQPGVLGSTIQIQAAVSGTTPSFVGVDITLVWSS